MFQSVWGDDCDRRDSFFFVRVRRFRDSPNLFYALFVCWFSLFLWFCLFFGNSRPKNRFLHSIGSSMATTTKKKRNKKIKNSFFFSEPFWCQEERVSSSFASSLFSSSSPSSPFILLFGTTDRWSTCRLQKKKFVQYRRVNIKVNSISLQFQWNRT